MIQDEGRRRRRRRRGSVVRPLLALALLLVVFGVGIAVGEALHDNPRPGGTLTYVRTLPPGSISAP